MYKAIGLRSVAFLFKEIIINILALLLPEQDEQFNIQQTENQLIILNL